MASGNDYYDKDYIKDALEELKILYLKTECINSNIHTIVYRNIYDNYPRWISRYNNHNSIDISCIISEKKEIDNQLTDLSIEFITKYVSIYDKMFSILHTIFNDKEGNFVTTADKVPAILKKLNIDRPYVCIYKYAVEVFLKEIKEFKFIIDLKESEIRNLYIHNYSKTQIELTPSNTNNLIPNYKIEIKNCKNSKKCVIFNPNSNDDFSYANEFTRKIINKLDVLIKTFRIDYKNKVNLPSEVSMLRYDSIDDCLKEEKVQISYVVVIYNPEDHIKRTVSQNIKGILPNENENNDYNSRFEYYIQHENKKPVFFSHSPQVIEILNNISNYRDNTKPSLLLYNHEVNNYSRINNSIIPKDRNLLCKMLMKDYERYYLSLQQEGKIKFLCDIVKDIMDKSNCYSNIYDMLREISMNDITEKDIIVIEDLIDKLSIEFKISLYHNIKNSDKINDDIKTILINLCNKYGISG